MFLGLVYVYMCTGNDNIVRVGERLKRTARLETKRQHSVRTLEAAAAEEECEA